MSARIIVDIYAVAVGVEGGKDGAGMIHHELEVVTDSNILYIPISADILLNQRNDMLIK